MRDRGRKLDMPHPLAADLGNRDLDTAFFADDALVFHALVLAAQAFIVLDRAKDARAEQAVPLRLAGAVVDRLRLLDLAVGPAPAAIWRSQSDLVMGNSIPLLRGGHEVHQFLVPAQ